MNYIETTSDIPPQITPVFDHFSSRYNATSTPLSPNYSLTIAFFLNTSHAHNLRADHRLFNPNPTITAQEITLSQQNPNQRSDINQAAALPRQPTTMVETHLLANVG